MRYRRFGRSDLEVSEVGFGVWTLASDWWGVVEDTQGLLHAALDAGINFIDTAPVYGDGGVGEELLADVLKAQRDDIVLTTKCGYDIDAARKFPGQSERPHDWEPASVRLQLEASLRRLGTDHIDLYQLHNPRIEPILDDALWEELEKFKRRGQGARARRRARPRDRLGRGRARGARDARHRLAADGVQRARAGARPHVRGASPRSPTGDVGLISRVPHASDTLSGKITRDTVFPPGDHRSHRNRDNMLDNFEKAETLSFLWEGTGRTDRPGRDRRHPRQPRVRDGAAHRASTSTTCASTRPPVDLPLTADEMAQLDELWDDNFDVDNRYEMPLKSSTGG